MTEKETSGDGMKKWRIIGYSVLALLIVYVIAKSYSKGNDINVYLHAGTQLLSGEDPYVENPFNNYLYSPLFAMLMAPLSALGLSIGRVFWALFNCFLIYRTWQIFRLYSGYAYRLPKPKIVTLIAVSAALAFNSFKSSNLFTIPLS